MSGLENFWNFKTMLDHHDATIEENELEPDQILRSSVPLFSSVQLSISQFDQITDEDVFHQAEDRLAQGKKFDAELQNLKQLPLPKLHELRRKIALHSHPDLNFQAGISNNDDLMSQANSLIDDEIKRRLVNDAGP